MLGLHQKSSVERKGAQAHQIVEPNQAAAEPEVLKGSRGAAGARNGHAEGRHDHRADQQGREDVPFRKGDFFETTNERLCIVFFL